MMFIGKLATVFLNGVAGLAVLTYFVVSGSREASVYTMSLARGTQMTAVRPDRTPTTIFCSDWGILYQNRFVDRGGMPSYEPIPIEREEELYLPNGVRVQISCS